MSDTAFRTGMQAPLERRGLRDRVYDLVLDTLMSSRLEPGARLSIDAIARDLDVSPTPVREALVQLERTGLVTRVAHKGYRVAAPLADGQLEALFDARLVLECGATELAARRGAIVLPRLERALDEHVRVMQRIRLARVGGEIPTEILREYFAVDWGFHHVIFEGASNPFLLDMSEAISTRVHRMRQSLETGVSDAEEAVVEHRAILEAFADGPDAAGDAMRAHIEKVRERSRQDALRAEHEAS
jgi:DNA-binding GntR family transcriptional regulator